MEEHYGGLKGLRHGLNNLKYLKNLSLNFCDNKLS